MGYRFTKKKAQEASQRSAEVRQNAKLYLDSRKRRGRYEYLIADEFGERWVSRQAIYHMQHAQEMSAIGREAWLELRRQQAEERRRTKQKQVA